MRRIARLALALSAVVLLAPAPGAAAETLTNDAVIAMLAAGLGEEVVVAKIRQSPAPRYDLSTGGIIALKQAGASDRVIQAMLAASAPAAPAAAPAASAEAAQREQEAIALYRQGKAAEALALFDRVAAERPAEDGPRIWKALALLQQARHARETTGKDYKPLVLGAWALLRPMGQRQAANPDWTFAVGKALWLNDRPDRGRRAAEKTLALRPDHHEAHLLLADMAYEEAVEADAPGRPPRDQTIRWREALACRERFEKALAVPGMPPALQAEALYRLGVVADVLDRKPAEARQAWERAAAADPASRYGRLAQDKLRAGRP